MCWAGVNRQMASISLVDDPIDIRVVIGDHNIDRCYSVMDFLIHIRWIELLKDVVCQVRVKYRLSMNTG